MSDEYVYGAFWAVVMVAALTFAFMCGRDSRLYSMCDEIRLRVGAESHQVMVKAEICK